jgi:hypothetical protein
VLSLEHVYERMWIGTDVVVEDLACSNIDNVGQWLEQLGMGMYTEAFVKVSYAL